MKWQAVIGLEIHVQLTTQSKIFSGAATEFGAKPNTQACIVDLAMPGVLPVLNEKVIIMAVKFGLAIGAKINKRCIFARKNYFYPDLPKGYQISQLEDPIIGKGNISINNNGKVKLIGITRAHLEEDAGKSIHDLYDDYTAIDLNRAGVPLLEIVSEPDMRSAEEAVHYAKKIHTLVQYLDICDGNMQEGSFRCDANISIRPYGQKELGIRTEVKNINSFKFLKNAINLEIERQQYLLENNDKVIQQTRLYDSIKNETRALRSKEEAGDYRYFPDPDLLPVVIDDALLDQIKDELPELPLVKKNRFISEFSLSEYDAEVLTSQKALADYFEQMLIDDNTRSHAKLCANWVMGELSAMFNKNKIKIQHSKISAPELAKLISRISDNTISGKTAKDIFQTMWNEQGTVDEIIKANGLKQITDNVEIEDIINNIIKNNIKQVDQLKAGNYKIMGFFMGQVMKATAGRANPKQVNQLLRTKLNLK